MRLKLFKTKFLRRLIASYSRRIMPAHFSDLLCRHGSIDRLYRLKTVVPYILRTLSQRLRMAYHPSDLVHRGALYRKQILNNLNIVNSVDKKRSEKGKIHNLRHVSVMAVFNRKNGAVALAV